MQRRVAAGVLSAGHARAILSLTDEEEMQRLADKIVNEDLSVRAADRIGELGWLAAFWVAGAPGWLVVAAGAASWLHEYLRARATAGGMAEIGAVTALGAQGERATVAP